jgi:hypothetical protein
MNYIIDLEPIERYGNDMVVKFWGDNGKEPLEISEAEIIAHYEVSNMLAYPIMQQNELVDGLHIPLEHYIEFCFIEPDFTRELIEYYFHKKNKLPSNYSKLEIT